MFRYKESISNDEVKLKASSLPSKKKKKRKKEVNGLLKIHSVRPVHVVGLNSTAF